MALGGGACSTDCIAISGDLYVEDPKDGRAIPKGVKGIVQSVWKREMVSTARHALTAAVFGFCALVLTARAEGGLRLVCVTVQRRIHWRCHGWRPRRCCRLPQYRSGSLVPLSLALQCGPHRHESFSLVVVVRQLYSYQCTVVVDLFPCSVSL